jgi:hypothetical protein
MSLPLIFRITGQGMDGLEKRGAAWGALLTARSAPSLTLLALYSMASLFLV